MNVFTLSHLYYAVNKHWLYYRAAMSFRNSQRRMALFAFCAGALAATFLLVAQAPFRTTTAGSEFKLEGSKGTAVMVAGGQRFRAGAFQEIFVRAPIHPSPSSAAEPRLQRLIVRFRTSERGPRLVGAEVRAGSQVLYRNNDLDITGDYSKRETATPPRSANVFNLGGLNVGSNAVIRLKLSFGGGFDSVVDNGEFVLIGVESEFPLKAITGHSTIPNNGGAIPRAGGASAPVAAGPTTAVIYALMPNNDLNWYRHEGIADGTFNWAAPAAKRVGIGWDVKQLFAAGGGVIYAVTPNNELLWYRHDGTGDGTFRWSASNGKQVGTGWGFRQIFSAGAGVIYAVSDQDELLWYRHDGVGDGSVRWAFNEGKVVGNGWRFKHLFSGGGGVIYAIDDSGDLLWFRHEGRNDGSHRWAAPAGKKVGSGWDVNQAFSAGAGVIYAINKQNELVWFRHEGISDGSNRWAGTGARKVGTGWSVKTIFSGATLQP